VTVEGFATAEGTARLAARFTAPSQRGFFREAQGLRLSSLGLGTYLGAETDAADGGYRDAVREALRLGVNLLDTAVNYRHQRSERAVGLALRDAVAAGEVARDEVVVCTKGGFLPFDGSLPTDPGAYLRERFVKRGLFDPATELAAGCHCMAPKYLADQVETSLANLGLETVDVYYLHNPETQLPELGRKAFYPRLTRAFAALEEQAASGRLRAYGTATWNGYRARPGSREFLDLEAVVACAREAGGENHRFRFIQLPVNLGMLEALTQPVKAARGRSWTLLQQAEDLGLTAVASAPLLQGKLGRGLPEVLRRHVPGCDTDAQRALQVARSLPGLTAVLAGMGRAAHVKENAALAGLAPLTAAQVQALFS
jgi:aryl-alcohol dehydrogenase-like predicted oxidoreductase